MSAMLIQMDQIQLIMAGHKTNLSNDATGANPKRTWVTELVPTVLEPLVPVCTICSIPGK